MSFLTYTTVFDVVQRAISQRRADTSSIETASVYSDLDIMNEATRLGDLGS